jgi:hypothetical protein
MCPMHLFQALVTFRFQVEPYRACERDDIDRKDQEAAAQARKNTDARNDSNNYR